MARATQTLLLIRSDSALRADFDAAGALLNFWNHSTRQQVPAADLARGALGLSRMQGQKVWLLSEEVWSQTLKLAENAVMGLDERSLASALAFEAETLCGIPAMEAAIGFCNAPSAKGERAFHIAVSERTLRDSLQSVVEQSGGKMAGLLSLSSLGSSTAAEKVPAEDDDVARAWMQAKFSLLKTRAADLPVIPPAVHPVKTQTYVLVAAALWLIAAGLCTAHWITSHRIQNEYNDATRRFNDQKSVVMQIDRRSAELRKQLADISAENTKRAASELNVITQLALQRNRLAELLRNIAEARPDDVVIETIASQNTIEVLIQGMATEAGPADEFATRLQTRLKPLGFETQPAEKQRHQSANGSEIWQFSLKLSVTPEIKTQSLVPHAAPLVRSND